jgi:PTH1 family peptidyl-tRNA hydrolase
MDTAHLIVGLGNPGPKYTGTRHNIGFMAVETLATRWGGTWAEEKKFKARMSRVNVEGNAIHLCEPLTLMNLSGEAVGAVSDYYRIPPATVLVIVDDVNLAFGQLRLRPAGGTGGHNGLSSIEQHLASADYPRLRVGVGRPTGEGRELSGFVLGKFAGAETAVLPGVLDRVVGAVACRLRHGVERAMNEFNGELELPNEPNDNKTP